MTDVRVGEGEGDGEVRGEGKGPTPMVSGIVGSLDFYIQACKHNGIQIFSTLGFKPNVSTINYSGMNPTFFSMNMDPARLKKNPDPHPTLFLNEKNIYIFIF